MSGPGGKPSDPLAAELAAAAAHADPAVLPPSTRAAPAKRLLLRLLRVYTTGQVSFNRAVSGVLGALDGRVRGLQQFQEHAARFQAGVVRFQTDVAGFQAHADSRLAGLEGHVRRLAEEAGGLARQVARMAPATSEQMFAPGAHAEFERQFRGSREEIRERQRIYVPILERAARQVGAGARFLDLGCGRGELLELARDAGLAAAGVESDASLVRACRERGLDAREGDLFDALWAEREKSLAGVSALQVVEHLPWAAVRTLVDLSYQRIRPGGCLVVETIHPASAYAMRAFYLDPTHRQPVPSEMAHFLFSQAGFRDVEVRLLNPVEEPKLSAAVAGNPALQGLSDLLFGFRDYAAIGWK